MQNTVRAQESAKDSYDRRENTEIQQIQPI